MGREPERLPLKRPLLSSGGGSRSDVNVNVVIELRGPSRSGATGDVIVVALCPSAMCRAHCVSVSNERWHWLQVNVPLWLLATAAVAVTAVVRPASSSSVSLLLYNRLWSLSSPLSLCKSNWHLLSWLNPLADGVRRAAILWAGASRSGPLLPANPDCGAAAPAPSVVLFFRRSLLG